MFLPCFLSKNENKGDHVFCIAIDQSRLYVFYVLCRALALPSTHRAYFYVLSSIVSRQFKLLWYGYRKCPCRLSHAVAFSVMLSAPEERTIYLALLSLVLMTTFCWFMGTNCTRILSRAPHDGERSPFIWGVFVGDFVPRRSLHRDYTPVNTRCFCCSNRMCLALLRFVERSESQNGPNQTAGTVGDCGCPNRQLTDFIPRLGHCAYFCLFVFNHPDQGKDLSEFFDSTDGVFTTPQVRPKTEGRYDK